MKNNNFEEYSNLELYFYLIDNFLIPYDEKYEDWKHLRENMLRICRENIARIYKENLNKEQNEKSI